MGGTFEEKGAPAGRLASAGAAGAAATVDKSKNALRGKSYAEGEDALRPPSSGGFIRKLEGSARVDQFTDQKTPAEVGMRLGPGMRVWADEGTVEIVFDDGSDLRLSEGGLAVIYGGSSRLAKTQDQEKTQVLVKEGSVKGGLGALDAPAGKGPDAGGKSS